MNVVAIIVVVVIVAATDDNAKGKIIEPLQSDVGLPLLKWEIEKERMNEKRREIYY